jgi:hypothetical protein
MKKRVKRASSGKKFAPGEHIRVVPLHQPALPVAPAAANLTYRGGPLIPNVEVFTIFWGNLWQSSSANVISKLNTFFGDIVVSPLIDQLAEYNVPGQAIGHGSFIGTKVITLNAPVGSVTDSQLRSQLKKWISSKTVAKNSPNRLYSFFSILGLFRFWAGVVRAKAIAAIITTSGRSITQ